MKEREIVKNLIVFGDEDVEWIEMELGEFMDYEFDDEAAKMLIEEFRLYAVYAPYSDSYYLRRDICFALECVAVLSRKRDYARIYRQLKKVLHKDFLHSLIEYRRFVKRYDSSEEIPEKFKGDGYIPNFVIKGGYDSICKYCDEFYHKLQSSKVLELYEQLKYLEDTVEYGGRKYVVRIPHDSDEIINEARYMENCIASRLPEYIGGKWIYAFVRSMDDPKTSLFDIIIDRKQANPTWVIERYHKDVQGENLDVFNKWWDDKRQLITQN